MKNPLLLSLFLIKYYRKQNCYTLLNMEYPFYILVKRVSNKSGLKNLFFFVKEIYEQISSVLWDRGSVNF